MRKWTVLITLGFLILFFFPSFGEASVRRLPSFNLYTLRGEEIPFCPSSLTILFFLDQECPSCLTDLVRFREAMERSGSKIALYPVCLQCDFRCIQNLEDSLGGRLTVYLAPPSLPALLGIWETPALFLVNSENRVLCQMKGEVSWEALQSSLPPTTKYRPSGEKAPCNGGLCS